MNTPVQKFFYHGNETAITQHAAALILAEAYRAVSHRGGFSMVLAGGNSPKPLYTMLAQGVSTELLERLTLPLPDGRSKSGFDRRLRLPEKTWLFMGDERCVPLDHPDSNCRMIKETLLLHSALAEEHFVRMAGEQADTEQAARDYENRLRSFFLTSDNPQEFPRFDLILLGLGDDGHTASLFPDNSDLLQEDGRWVRSVDAPAGKPPGKRLTLTLPVINHAKNIIFFTSGKHKSELAEKIFFEQENSVPASLIKPVNVNLFWFTTQP